MRNYVLWAGVALVLTASCGLVLTASCSKEKPAKVFSKSGLDFSRFEAVVDTSRTALYALRNRAGMEVCITNFGGRIVSMLVPDKRGVMHDVVLGFDNIEDYMQIPSDFGASIGRYANRIQNGRFTLDGEEYQLPRNNFGHCLHGGPKGWQYRVYEACQPDSTTLELSLVSPDGDEGFPGQVTAKVVYKLAENNALHIRYTATTDRKTIINMTNHSYFNLSGDPSKPATDHLLFLYADTYTPIDSTYMTTGEIAPVKGTPMDFLQLKPVGQDIDAPDFEQLRNGNGYDHNWILNTGNDSTLLAARLVSPVTGIALEVYTDEPGIQVYSGNFLDGSVRGKKGIAYPQRASVCLETQHYPDSPNKPQWPSVVLNPGETYQSTCIFKFSTWPRERPLPHDSEHIMPICRFHDSFTHD